MCAGPRDPVSCRVHVCLLMSQVQHCSLGLVDARQKGTVLKCLFQALRSGLLSMMLTEQSRRLLK
jgi:hypothetical protein